MDADINWAKNIDSSNRAEKREESAGTSGDPATNTRSKLALDSDENWQP